MKKTLLLLLLLCFSGTISAMTFDEWSERCKQNGWSNYKCKWAWSKYAQELGVKSTNINIPWDAATFEKIRAEANALKM